MSLILICVLSLSRSNQSTVFSALTLTYRMGQIVGLPLGGLLAHPERHFPNIFNTPFWLHYPFLLPCLAGALGALIGLVLGMIFLNEVCYILLPTLIASFA